MTKTEVEHETIDRVLTPEALNFLAQLHRKFNPQRLDLLNQRRERQAKIDHSENPQFLASTAHIRQDPNWKVAPTPEDLQKRWVEITGPTDRKMVINALNSGADVFMADFEDSNSPTWKNIIEGQQNLIDAVAGNINFTSPEGKQYKLNVNSAVLMVRPRGWHLEETNFKINGETVSASLFDFGLFFFHNAKALIDKKTAPYFYLPKMESHLEAKLWNDVFIFAQETLGIPRGTIRATVLIENILAAFEMEEILYELREHSAGLNAGRWDYIFSIIKKFHSRPNLLFPDRAQITMTVPFMKAYTDLLVQTCHKRGAHAMGGMAAFVPSRKDPAINTVAMAKVREDKLREVEDGFDGTWVAHPDLVFIAKEIFQNVLGAKANQLDKKRDDVQIFASELINFEIKGGKITEEGMRKNISIGLQYLQSWLMGVGAVTIFNLMEDAATAEISRSQLWQWIHHPKSRLLSGQEVTPDLYLTFANEEMEIIRKEFGERAVRLGEARQLLDNLVLNKHFTEFLTLYAYEYLEKK